MSARVLLAVVVAGMLTGAILATAATAAIAFEPWPGGDCDE